MRVLLAVVFSLSSTAEAATPQLEKARAEDAALRKDGTKVRLRHHVVRLIELWKDAEQAATSDRERMEAGRGGAEAWALLAHWSGRADDLAQAKQEKERLETKTLRKIEANGRELVIDASGEFAIEKGTYGRHRLYFDLSPMIAVKEALGELALGAREVERARVTQLDADTVRIVIDFTGPIADADIRGDRIRLKLSSESGGLSDVSLDEIVEEVKEAYAEPAKLKRSTRDAAKARRPSLLAIKKVVVDPGHGGRDTGALGKNSLREKDVNLAIALKLGGELEKLGVKVVYTRKDDRFVSLEKRTAIANRSGADFFISIHANSNRSKRIRGIETYYLNTSSSRYASRLARRENGQGDAPELDPSVDDQREVSELPDGALGADIRLILADLAMRSATVESKRVAGYVQSALIGSLRKDYDGVQDLGVKHALFAVLLGVRMPSILIETGFVTHATESERLASSAYQTRVAKAIARGVERFVDERQQLAVNVRQRFGE